MVEKPADGSRRKVMRAVAGGVTAGLFGAYFADRRIGKNDAAAG
jgi:hypothetical protein